MRPLRSTIRRFVVDTFGLGLLGITEDTSMMTQRLRWLDRQPWRRRRTKTAVATLAVAAMCAMVLPMSRPRPAQAKPPQSALAARVVPASPRIAKPDTVAVAPENMIAEVPSVAAAPIADTTIYEFRDVDVKPDLVHSELPAYPEAAKQAGLEEGAIVEMIVGTDGGSASGNRIYEFWQLTTKPGLLHSELPIYPETARRDSIEARVVVHVFLAKSGLVDSARVISIAPLAPDGVPTRVDGGAWVVREPYNTEFRDAAVAAALKFRFTPAMVDSVPVRVGFMNRIEFRLRPKTP